MTHSGRPAVTDLLHHIADEHVSQQVVSGRVGKDGIGVEGRSSGFRVCQVVMVKQSFRAIKREIRIMVRGLGGEAANYLRKPT
jgi:hypothetical protein